MSSKKYHTVYQTTDLTNGMIYIGVHSTNEPNDSYLGSGDRILHAIRKRGKENFKKDILAIFESKELAYKFELEMVNLEFINREDTYNITTGGKIPPDATGRKMSAEVCHRQSLRNLRLGLKPPVRDRPHTAETKTKMSLAQRGERNHAFGKTLSEDHKRKISHSVKKAILGQPRKKQELVTCNFCGLTGGSQNMNRYHFNNCKSNLFK